MWNKLVFMWHVHWLRVEYQKRLTQVSRDRWINCKRGLITREREIVHEWYGREYNRLTEEYLK